jgi:hypothetical protein
MKLAYDLSVGAMDKTHPLDLDRYVLHLWDQRNEKYSNRDSSGNVGMKYERN